MCKWKISMVELELRHPGNQASFVWKNWYLTKCLNLFSQIYFSSTFSSVTFGDMSNKLVDETMKNKDFMRFADEKKR